MPDELANNWQKQMELAWIETEITVNPEYDRQNVDLFEEMFGEKNTCNHLDRVTRQQLMKNPYVENLIEMGYDRADQEQSQLLSDKTFPMNIYGRVYQTQEEYDALHDFINGLWQSARCPLSVERAFRVFYKSQRTTQTTQCSILSTTSAAIYGTNCSAQMGEWTLSLPQWKITLIMVMKAQNIADSIDDRCNLSSDR